VYPSEHLSPKEIQWREACEGRFYAFVRGVAPWLQVGSVHEEVCDWMQRNFESGIEHHLVLLPRGHLKSTLAYLWVCWRIIRNPAITFLYASASLKLAEMQLASIKNTLAGEKVARYWPTLIGPDEGKRTVWRQYEISVDHPLRALKGVRDFTVRAVGLGHGVTGSHGDVLMLDDIVAPEAEQYSPWTVEGRAKLDTWYSFVVGSVLNPGGEVVGVGTRYHAKDIYQKLIDLQKEEIDKYGEIVSTEKLYNIMVRVVEKDGEFLWPRKAGPDGKAYGFNKKELATKKANYLDKAKFYSQYYQNPSNPEDSAFTDQFQYYDKSHLRNENGRWYMGGSILNVYSAVDIASTMEKRSDYTTIVTIGIDSENRRYVLHIDRFQTDRISFIVDRLFMVVDKWRPRRVKIEVVAAQKFVYTSTLDAMRERNVFFNLDEYKPQGRGNKEIRINNTLEPLYKNQLVFHYRGGNCEILEDELVLQHPPHDDISDSLMIANEMAERPSITGKKRGNQSNIVQFDSRFGGVRRVG